MKTDTAERPANPFPVREGAARSGMVDVEQQRAIAEVQAALIVARANPRDEVRARDQIMQDCWKNQR